MLDEAQALVARYDYLPFGEQIPTGYDGRTALWGAASAWDGRTPDGLTEKFTGKERDGETGLDFFGARYYSGAQGRFGSPDPDNRGGDVLEPQSLNAYSYALNNPLRFVDPSGAAVWDADRPIGSVSLRVYTFYQNIDVAALLSGGRPVEIGVGLRKMNDNLREFRQNGSSLFYPANSEGGGCTAGCYNYYQENIEGFQLRVHFSYDTNNALIGASIVRAPEPSAETKKSDGGPMIVNATALPGGLPPVPQVRGVKIDPAALRKLTPEELDALINATLALPAGDLRDAILQATNREEARRSDSSPRRLPSGGKCTTADGGTVNCQGPN